MRDNASARGRVHSYPQDGKASPTIMIVDRVKVRLRVQRYDTVTVRLSPLYSREGRSGRKTYP